MDKYILNPDGTTRPATTDTEFWNWFEKADRRVRYSEVGDVSVSTVFLGFDHGFDENGDPVLFETMIFGGPEDGWQTRSCTIDEARDMHKEACYEAFGPGEYVCTKCGQVCDVIEKSWKERENFWGAPCYRTEYEDVSECCHVEAEDLW